MLRLYFYMEVNREKVAFVLSTISIFRQLVLTFFWPSVDKNLYLDRTTPC